MHPNKMLKQGPQNMQKTEITKRKSKHSKSAQDMLKMKAINQYN